MPPRKRESEDTVDSKSKKRVNDNASHNDMQSDNEEDPVHEDALGDEFEEEIIIADEENDGEEMDEPQTRVWRAGIDPIGEDEMLDFEPSAYALYHKLNVEWPCLSIDILKDNLGHYRTKFPATVYTVAGSQADDVTKNKVSVLKMTRLHRMQNDDPDEGINLDEADDDDDDDEDPVITARTFRHHGSVNRIRVMPQLSHILATWSETGKVFFFNINEYLTALDRETEIGDNLQPFFTFSGHSDEGYAMAWSGVKQGRFATGGCDGNIFVYQVDDSTGGVVVDPVPFSGHSGSVEDIQWSPSEPTVFASCGSDGTIRVWDIRQPQHKPMLTIAAQTNGADVNVIAWNTKVTYLLASGSDDGSLKVWDLRQPQTPAALFEWHKRAITSVQWHPHEDSVLACASEDDSVSVWDMALEADAEEVAREAVGATVTDYNIPPQLLFVHQGQKHIKEVHFHSQIPSLLISTAMDGIDIFKPANLEVLLPPAPTQPQDIGITVD